MLKSRSNNRFTDPEKPSLIDLISRYKTDREYPTDPNETPSSDEAHDVAATLAGVKPAALFFIPNFDGIEINEKKVMALAEKEGCTVIPLGSTGKYERFTIARKKQDAERLEALFSLTEKEFFTPKVEREIGYILGYNKDSIDRYIRKTYSK